MEDFPGDVGESLDKDGSPVVSSGSELWVISYSI
jgi:hypothetical protein